jgi:hypothetical protein
MQPLPSFWLLSIPLIPNAGPDKESGKESDKKQNFKCGSYMERGLITAGRIGVLILNVLDQDKFVAA